uniref:NR LBD domain-containing protein n=1 Tax=Heterorhabditis bacteriophora TaxID=37862 RepID=A0A1I7XAM4_HETBA
MNYFRVSAVWGVAASPLSVFIMVPVHVTVAKHFSAEVYLKVEYTTVEPITIVTSQMVKSRNRCRSCRLRNCLVGGMNPKHVREERSKIEKLPISEIPSSEQEGLDKKKIPEEHQLTLFMCALEKQTELLTDEDVRANDVICEWSRDISLTFGLQNPQLVIKRSQMIWSCSRIMKATDIYSSWYRAFVLHADWAMSIPDFRVLPLSDQVCVDGLSNIDTNKPKIINPIILFSDCLLSENGSVICNRVRDRLLEALATHIERRFPTMSSSHKTMRALKATLMLPSFTHIGQVESSLIQHLSATDLYQLSGVPMELVGGSRP